MTQTTVAADLHQPLDIHPDLSTEITFHLIVASNDLAQAGDAVLARAFFRCAGRGLVLRIDQLPHVRSPWMGLGPRYHAEMSCTARLWDHDELSR